MKKVVLLLVLMVVFPMHVFASMSESKAATEAFKLWGNASWKGTGQSWLQTSAMKLLGFLSPGCEEDITVVGKGSNTWDAAFASLPIDKGISGTYSGTRFLHSSSPAAPTDPGTHTMVPGALTASKIQFLLDGQPVGDQTPLIFNSDRTGWQVDLQWDSTTVPDGLHVLCGVLIHDDGAQSKTRATMIIVKQGQ